MAKIQKKKESKRKVGRLPKDAKKEDITEKKEEVVVKKLPSPKQIAEKGIRKFFNNITEEQWKLMGRMGSPPKREAWAPEDKVLLLEIRNDGRCYPQVVSYTGSGYILYQEIPKRIWVMKTLEEDVPPFFGFPWILPHPFWVWRLVGIKKKVWIPSLVFLEGNRKPLNLPRENLPVGSEAFIVDWRKVKPDLLTPTEYDRIQDTIVAGAVLEAQASMRKGTLFNWTTIIIGAVILIVVVFLAMRFLAGGG